MKIVSGSLPLYGICDCGRNVWPHLDELQDHFIEIQYFIELTMAVAVPFSVLYLDPFVDV